MCLLPWDSQIHSVCATDRCWWHLYTIQASSDYIHNKTKPADETVFPGQAACGDRIVELASFLVRGTGCTPPRLSLPSEATWPHCSYQLPWTFVTLYRAPCLSLLHIVKVCTGSSSAETCLASLSSFTECLPCIRLWRNEDRLELACPPGTHRQELGDHRALWADSLPGRYRTVAGVGSDKFPKRHRA